MNKDLTRYSECGLCCVSVVWLYDSVSTNLVLVLLATAAYVSTVLVLPKVVLTVPLQDND